jgi:hypothetical protein
MVWDDNDVTASQEAEWVYPPSSRGSSPTRVSSELSGPPATRSQRGVQSTGAPSASAASVSTLRKSDARDGATWVLSRAALFAVGTALGVGIGSLARGWLTGHDEPVSVAPPVAATGTATALAALGGSPAPVAAAAPIRTVDVSNLPRVTSTPARQPRPILRRTKTSRPASPNAAEQPEEGSVPGAGGGMLGVATGIGASARPPANGAPASGPTPLIPPEPERGEQPAFGVQFSKGVGAAFDDK